MASVQGTVSAYDPATGTGTLRTDDGSPMEFAEAAVRAGGLRLLRAGQRVEVHRSAGVVTELRIPGDIGRARS